MLKRITLALFLALTALSLPALSQPADMAMTNQSVTVNINEANAETLSERLVGIGPSRAEAIVRYREEFGPFFAADDLLQVKGIGPSTLDRNRERIVLE